MKDCEPIRTEEEYQAALARIREIFHAEEGTPEGDELENLVDSIEPYEDEHYPIDPPSPSAAREYEMDQAGMAPTDAHISTESHGVVATPPPPPTASGKLREDSAGAHDELREDAAAAKQALTESTIAEEGDSDPYSEYRAQRLEPDS